MVVLTMVLFVLGFLSGCDLFSTPTIGTTQQVTPTQPPSKVVPSPAVTVRQELEEQLEMLHALAVAEKGRGHDVAQAEQWLVEAEQALRSDDLALAREKLRQAGGALGVDLP
jgi:hypothetical protein